jgi:hypothetical protein
MTLCSRSIELSGERPRHARMMLMRHCARQAPNAVSMTRARCVKQLRSARVVARHRFSRAGTSLALGEKSVDDRGARRHERGLEEV